MFTAIVYARTSTTQQKTQETIKAQIARAKAIVERRGLTVLKYGLRKDGWLVDDGVTGSMLAGRELAKLIDDLEMAKVRPDFLIVYSLSRIAREDKTSGMQKQVQSAQDWGRIKAVLRASGVKVLDEDGENDPNNVLFDLKTSLSGEEYKLIRARTMAGKARHLADNKDARGGKAPYGYMHVGSKGNWHREPHPEDSKHLVQILKWIVQGGFTYAASKATAAKFLTPMFDTTDRKNKAKDWTPTRWTPVTVQNLAKNASLYLGSQTVIYDGKPHKLTYPPIIEPKLYRDVQLRVRQKALSRRLVMLSTGYVKCACGAWIHCKNSHDKHHATCPKKCGRMSEKEFSAALWNFVVARLVEIAQVKPTKASKDTLSARIAEAKAAVATIEQDIAQLLDLYGLGLDKSVWKIRNDALNDRKAQAQAEVMALEVERTEAEGKKAQEKSLESRIRWVLREVRGEVRLDRKRAILGQLLGLGNFATIMFCQGYARLTLPAFKTLPKITVRTDKDVWTQMQGVSREVLDLIYEADDAIEHVAVG